MKALRLTETGVCLDCNVELPSLDEEYNVLVKVFYAGVCKTDIAIARHLIPAKKGVTLGHEFCGKIVDVLNDQNNARGLKIGETVSANPMQFGNTGDLMCGKEINGCFAEYIRLPAKNIVKLGDKLLNPLGAFLEPVAASLAPYKYIPSKTPRIGIYGDSRIARLTYQIGKILNLSPELIHDDRLLTPNHYDFLIETEISNPKPLLDSLKYGGTLILKSRNFKILSIVPNDIAMKEFKILGARYGDFTLSKELLLKSLTTEDPNLNFRKLFGKTYTLENFKTAFETADSKESKKIFFKICAE